MKDAARVTQIVRDVKLMLPAHEPRAAAMNDRVAEGEAIRTGNLSRSELTFADLSIIRLGANTIFSFNRAGRDSVLTNGSMLLQVPSSSGLRNIRTDPVTVAITGTTIIFEHTRGGGSRLIVLEGGARLALTRVRDQRRDVVGGQMLDVPAGARTLGLPVEISLEQLMRTHPLVRNFRELPSRDRVAAASRDQTTRMREAGQNPGSLRGPGNPGTPAGAPGAGTPAGAPVAPAPGPMGPGPGRGP